MRFALNNIFRAILVMTPYQILASEAGMHEFPRFVAGFCITLAYLNFMSLLGKLAGKE